MSQIRYYNLLLLFYFSVVIGKVLVPDSNSSANSELLIRLDKAKEYYELTNNGIQYTIKGPAEVKIFSKAAFPKKTVNELKDFSFKVSINDLEIELNNTKKLDKKAFSSEHPMHLYTYASKDVLVLPSGMYNIKISKNSKWDCSPILIRTLQSNRKSKNIIKEEIVFSEDLSENIYNSKFKEYFISSSNSTVMPLYYVLDFYNPLFINNSNDFLEINIRGLHEGFYDDYKIINMILEKDGQLDTKYHILSIPHPSKIVFGTDYIPSRLNKIYIRNKGEYQELKIDSKNENLLVRANRILTNRKLN